MKILCVGGGTLGSVTPLLAVVEKLNSHFDGLVKEWWGTPQGPERRLVEAAGFSFQPISSGKWRRYFSWYNLFDVLKIIWGFIQAWWRLKSAQPDIILTAGSYVAVPVAWAAYCWRLPVLAHQQDVRPSLANKLIQPVVRKITVSLPVSLKDFPAHKTILTGNPVRQIFTQPLAAGEAKRRLGLSPDRPAILIIGGGTGAQALNELIAKSLTGFLQFTQVIHVVGANQPLPPACAGYLPLAFSLDSLTLMSASEVVVTRAGMGTLTELASLQKPSVVIPIPASHQEDNAAYFAKQGAVVLLPQTHLTPDTLIVTVSQLLQDKDSRQKLGRRFYELMPPQAAEKIANLAVSAIK